MKILIIGLGSIGKKHVEAIQTILPHVEIFALRSNKQAEKIENIQNIYLFDDIAHLDVEFAIIANPTSEHKKVISQLIGYDISLFIEKPLYSSLDIVELIDLISKRGIFTYVACNLRFLDCIRYLKEQLPDLQNKRLNEVNVYCGSYLPDWRKNVDFRKTYSAITELGGGVHIDLIHELDYLYWLFGKPLRINRTFKKQSSLAISAYDYANYLLEYDGFCANVVLNYYRRDPKRTMELVFDDETWGIDLLANQVICNGQILNSSDQKIADTYILQMKYFIKCMEEKQVTFNTVNDAFEVLKICLDR